MMREEPLVKVGGGVIISGLVGLIHGGLDATGEMPGLAHGILAYAPAGVSALVTATRKNGIEEPVERVGYGLLSAGVSSVATAAGYLVGRILVAGYKSING